MHASVKALSWSVGLLFLVQVLGCGDSDKSSVDAAVDLGPPTPDSPVATDLARDLPAVPDSSATALDVGTPDLPVVVDATALDGATSPLDAPPGGLDGSPLDSAYDLTAYDGLALAPDGPAGIDSGPPDVAPDGFSPGPAIPIVVNSGDTGQYSLADGTWQLFYFDATAGQLYCLSGLSGSVRGYVGASAAVSPTSYQYATDAEGNLAFTAASAQRYYVAVATSGGGVSGYFQVADGGQLLALGANSVTLPAPDRDNYYFFRFPITQGHGYSVSVTGTATDVGLGLSPKAERASNGQFLHQLRGVSGPLPFSNEAVPDTSVAESYSGYYFLFLHVYSAASVTVTVTQTS